MIPGGHKARYKYPGGPHTDRSDDGKTIAIDSEYARHVYVSAGDVCIFMKMDDVFSLKLIVRLFSRASFRSSMMRW